MKLDDIYSPVFVGRPPTDAGRGLVCLPDGEVRCYNFGSQGIEDGRFYLGSTDGGLSWTKHKLPDDHLGADRRNPITGDYIRLIAPPLAAAYRTAVTGVGHKKDAVGNYTPESATEFQTVAVRYCGGIDGPCKITGLPQDPPVWGNPRPPVFVRGGRRILVGAERSNAVIVLCSDDGGENWRRSEEIKIPLLRPYRPTRWNHGPCEPTMVELSDGRVWMLMRTGRDNFYESYSADGGESWTEPVPSRFYGTRTMPTLGRLSDGRILFSWCNTTPLPEVERNEATRLLMGNSRWHGSGTDVFTNRDAAHLAISEDEGRNWIGFREVWLDPRRNAADYAKTGGIDRGVHQSQFVELGNGKILMALGQHWLHRSFVIFDVAWLYEKERKDDFAHGLEDWSVQTYIAGVEGHKAINRKAGASVVRHPQEPDRHAMRIARPHDPDLVTDNQGGTWNFPAGMRGEVAIRFMLPEGSQGVRISLVDRWINPTDATIEEYALYSMPITVEKVAVDRWHEAVFEWNIESESGPGHCTVRIDGAVHAELPLLRKSVNGISYLHLISIAQKQDESGVLVESVHALVQR